jgi:hypothetical protein
MGSGLLYSPMVAIVLSLNIGIAFLCLGIAWKLLQFRQKLQRVTHALIIAQRKTDQVLCNAPHYILMGQTGTAHLQKQLLGLGPAQQSLLRWFTMFTLIRSLLSYSGRQRSRSIFSRPSHKGKR